MIFSRHELSRAGPDLFPREGEGPKLAFVMALPWCSRTRSGVRGGTSSALPISSTDTGNDGLSPRDGWRQATVRGGGPDMSAGTTEVTAPFLAKPGGQPRSPALCSHCY